MYINSNTTDINDMKKNFVISALILTFSISLSLLSGCTVSSDWSRDTTDNENIPDAVNDTYTLDLNNIQPLSVLDNDTDADSDTLTVESTTDCTNGGTVAINTDYTITYTPPNTYPGSDTFTYTISDGNSGADTASVTISYTKSTLSMNQSDPASTDDASYLSTADITFTITNSGTTTASSLSFTGLSGSWARNGGTCDQSIAVDATCTYIAQFTSPGEATVNDTIILTYNDGTTSSAQTTKDVVGNGIPASITVAPVYSNNKDWNDYIANDDSNNDAYNQDDTACTSATNLPSDCIHGGEKLKAEFTLESSCSNLTVSENLGAFNWVCATAASSVIFYTSGLKFDKGLQDLISNTSWKTNYISISNGTYTIAQSSAAAWWENTINSLPDSSGGVESLGTSGTIYTLNSNSTGQGYNITADKVGIVIFSGYKFTYNSNPATDNCNASDGTTTGADTMCIISTGNSPSAKKFLWIERNFEAAGTNNTAEYRIFFYDTTISQIRNTGVQNTSSKGILLTSADFNLLYNNVVANSSDSGVELNASPKNVLSYINTPNNVEGILLNNADGNFITHAIISNNSIGIKFESGSESNNLSFITATNNSSQGIFIDSSDSNNLNQVVTVNSTEGIKITASSTLKFAQFVAANNSSLGMSLTNYSVEFDGKLLMGQNGQDCWKGLGSTGGMNVSGGNCSPVAPSDAGSPIVVDLSNSFKAEVSSADSLNSTSSNPAKIYNDGITDWIEFDNIFRNWGLDGASDFPNSNNANRCTGGDNCVIWDWRIESADTNIYNRSGDGENSNPAFTNGDTCPSPVDGSQIFTGNTYLMNALEIIGDSIGDEDGLCETEESCIYAPHFGAYLGEGDYTAKTCSFTNGTVEDVTIYAY